MRRGRCCDSVCQEWWEEYRRLYQGGKSLWGEEGLSVCEEPSLISQLKCIKLNNPLNKMDRGEIEKMVKDENQKVGWCESGEDGAQ